MARAAGGPSLTIGWAFAALRAILPHPSLWGTGLRQVRRLTPPGWWRRPPFLPVPAPEYLRFRMETAYGGTGEARLVATDLVTYLRWCRRFPG